MDYLYSFMLALAMTIVLIPLLIRFSVRLRLVDDPNVSDRKVHDQVMPRSGGLGIIFGAFIPLLFLLPIEGQLLSFIAGAIIIISFGLLDDLLELSPIWKIIGQALGIIAVMAGGLLIDQVPLLGLGSAPSWVSYPLTFVFLLGVINGVNFSDGLDGLAAGTSLMALLLIFVLAILGGHHAVALIALTVTAGVLGFLRYNTHPARIFMGDAGSQFLGFVIACLAIMISQSETSPLNPVLALLILGIPVMDIIMVVPVRIKKKLPLPGPDKEHFHHQIAKLGFYHHEVVAIIYLLQAFILGSAFLLRYQSDLSLLAFYTFYITVILGLLYLANMTNWRVRVPEVAGEGKERRNPYLRKMYWIYQNAPLTVEMLLAFYLIVTPAFARQSGSDIGVLAIILAVGLLPLALLLRKRAPILLARLCCYPACILVVYVLLHDNALADKLAFFNGYLIAVVVFLALAIRMTRRTDFRLDTQDLLVLLVVILVPQLPFELLDDLSVSNFALQLVVLLYCCEFVLGRATGNFKVLTSSSIMGLLLIGLSSMLVS